MNTIDAIRKRKSIRGYKREPVPREVIRDILDAAGRAPSAMNTQPWEFVVVTGEPLEKIREKCVQHLRAGVRTDPDHQVVGWTKDSVYRIRQVELAKHIFRIMDIPRGDRDKRAAWRERGFRYFDAPAAIIITVDKSLAESAPLLDLGAAMQTICLAALEHGLGTCIHDQGVMYADVIKEHTGIPESKRLVIAISIGYPDEDDVVNTISSTRVSVDDTTLWKGFD